MIGPPLSPLEKLLAVPATVVWWTLAPFVYGYCFLRQRRR